MLSPEVLNLVGGWVFGVVSQVEEQFLGSAGVVDMSSVCIVVLF